MLARQPLPTFSTPFVGRDSEITYVIELLGNVHCRLLTLVGPGGIGKTRLAIEVAERWSQAFADGVSFVQLQSVESSEQVIHTLANAVGLVSDNAHDPRAQLLNQLRDQTLLLILDNFEHLLGSTGLISELLAAAPRLKIVVTSREGLNVRDEWLVPVEGLVVPDGQQVYDLEAYSAVQLFVACARRMRPDFSLIDQEQAVVHLCQLLGGVPLALELAASWVRALSVGEIIALVSHNLDFLSARWRDMPARHQSMRAVFDASWRWLPEPLQAAFQSLAVFRGGFTAEAAVYVAQASLQDIAALIDKSLVQVDKNGRYGLHELLRQYAFEKLDTNVENRERVLDRHCAYYTDLMQRREVSVELGDQAVLLAEMDNARAAWLRAVQQRNRAALERAAPAMHWLLHFQARHDEGAELFFLAEQAFKDVSETDDGRYILAVMPLYRAFFAPHRLPRGNIPPVDIDAALDVWETLDERREMGLPLSRAMLALANRGGELGQIVALARKSLAFSRRHGDRSGEAIALATLGSISFAYYGDFEEAERLFQDALVIDHEIDFHLNARWVEGALGTLAILRGRYVEARNHFAASVEHHRAGSITRYLDLRLFQLGEAELELGNAEVAVEHFAQSRALAERLQRHAHVAEVLAGYGLAAAYAGDDGTAATYYHQSRVYLETHHLDMTGAEASPLNLGLLALLLGDFSTACTLFQSMTSDSEARRDRVLMLRCHCRLGHAYLGLGDEEPARRALFTALRDALTFGALTVQLEALAGIARLSRLPPQHAVALLSYVRAQQATNRYSRGLAVDTLSHFEETLTSDEFEAAVKLGETLSSDAAVALAEPSGAGVSHDQTDANRDLVEPLSRRELEVLVLIGEGLSNREIADQLFVGVSTIKKHINHIYGKLGASDRASVVTRARALRLIP